MLATLRLSATRATPASLALPPRSFSSTPELDDDAAARARVPRGRDVRTREFPSTDADLQALDADMATATCSPYAFASLLALAECASPHTPTPHRLPQVHYLLALCNTTPTKHGDCMEASWYSPSPPPAIFRRERPDPVSPISTSSSSSTCSSSLSSPTRFKPRRHLSLRDLLCAETSLSKRSPGRAKPSPRRQCGMPECYKYALSGGFCIRHGGGKRCNVDGCQTVAQSGGRCKAHGGGSKCKAPNCGLVARRHGFCMAHGGRQSCKVVGCSKCAHGGGFCISHGGGKRCSSITCTKSAQAGGFCYSHGGGKRCSAPECFQAARKGGLCIRHRKSTSLMSSDSPLKLPML